MRVSDWSDGVCSSDLTAAFAGKGLSWLLFDATFAGGAADCRLASGACWPFLRENARLILFGTYPEVEQWRSAAAAAALLSCLAFSFVPRFWRSRLGLDRKRTRLNSSH